MKNTKIKACSLLYLQHFHIDFMNIKIILRRLMNRKKWAVIRSSFKTNEWKGYGKTNGNFEKLKKEKQKGSKVNYLKIFLVVYVTSTILGKIFRINLKRKIG